MKPKFPQIVRLLEQRLEAGNYYEEGLPGERSLANEFGVSYMTARRAVQELKQRGTVCKDTHKPINKNDLRIALIAPAFDSPSYNNWYFGLSKTVLERGGIVRPIKYVDWTDASITETLNDSYTGIFLIAPSLPDLPSVLLERLQSERHRLITLFSNFTDLGIPCVDMGSQLFLPRIADHLASLGHQRVDCLNVQQLNPQMRARIDAWQRTSDDHGFVSRLFSEPIEPFTEPGEAALHLAGRLFDSGELDNTTALFCTINEAARGVLRAAYERGIHVGKELSLCSCDSPRQAKLMTPSLTVLDNPPIEPLFSRALDWISCGGKGWDGPLWIRPDSIDVWVGESTGPVPSTSPGRFKFRNTSS